MATSEELERELDRICQEIDELRDYEHQIEMALSAAHGRFKWLRAPGSYLLKRDVARRIQLLKWRNNVVRNCYLAVKRDEEGEHRRSPFRAPGPADTLSPRTR
jgi:hypothetical protein